MRRSAVTVLFLLFLAAVTAALSGCGGGSGGTVGAPVSISLTPTTISLNRGDVLQASAQVLDANNNTIFSSTVTFSSSDSTIFTVSPAGLLCAGQWDTNFIVCAKSSSTPLPSVTATLTATTPSGNSTITSNIVPVTVHEHVDNVTLSPTAPACVSQGATAPANTLQFTATALSNSPSVCAPNPAPCVLPDVGTFNWGVSPPSVGTIDSSKQPVGQPGNQITIQAAAPGTSTVIASISGASSVPATFTTCPVASIAIHQTNTPTPPDTATSFTVAKAASVPLTAEVLDSNGLAVTALLSWTSSQPVIAGVNSAGLVTGNQPGTASVVTSCTPQNCNVNLRPIYSNVVTANVSGSSATFVFVTSKTAPASGASNSVVAIDTSNNTAGGGIALPKDAVVNSFLINSVGTLGYLGSNQGVIVLDTVGGKVNTTLSNLTGKVLAISPDGSRVLVSDAGNSDPTKRQVYVYNQTSNALEATLPISNATAADFSEDSFKAYLVAGNRLYVYNPLQSLHFVTLSGSSSDVRFLATGAMAYVAGAGADVVGTCNDTLLTTVAVGTPSLIATAPNGTQVLDANSPNIDQIDVTSTGGCPATVSNSFASHSFAGVPGFTARQLMVTPNSKQAIILSDQSSVLVYTLGATAGAGTTTTIPLAGGAHPLSGALTLDSAQLYVGADDNQVHRIDLAAGTDAQQISVSLCGTTACTADLVAARPSK